MVVFSPSAVAVHLTEPGGSPRNHLPVTITELEPRGELIRVHAIESALVGDARDEGLAGLLRQVVGDGLTPGAGQHLQESGDHQDQPGERGDPARGDSR